MEVGEIRGEMEMATRGRPHLAPTIVEPSEVAERLGISPGVVGDANGVKTFGDVVLDGGVSSLDPDVGERSSVTTTPSSIICCCLA